MTYFKMNDADKDECNHSSYIDKLEWRVRELINSFRSRSEAMEIADLSRQQLGRYLNGGVSFAFVPIARMAVYKGISLHWLATGKGEMMPSSRDQVADESARYGAPGRDTTLRALLLLEQALEAKNLVLKPSKKVQAVEIIAKMLEREESEELSSNIVQLIQLAS